MRFFSQSRRSHFFFFTTFGRRETQVQNVVIARLGHGAGRGRALALGRSGRSQPACLAICLTDKLASAMQVHRHTPTCSLLCASLLGSRTHAATSRASLSRTPPIPASGAQAPHALRRAGSNPTRHRLQPPTRSLCDEILLHVSASVHGCSRSSPRRGVLRPRWLTVVSAARFSAAVAASRSVCRSVCAEQ